MERRVPRLLTSLLLFILSAGAAAGPSPEAARLIEDLGLREAPVPASAIPGWAPSRVVVALMPAPADAQAAYRAAFIEAAGDDVQVVFPERNAFAPDEETLAGADAIIGLCLGITLKRADDALRWLHNYSVGMDRCTGYSDAQLANITFTNNQRLSAPTIAEHTLAMLLSLTRALPTYQAAQAEGTWRGPPRADQAFGELGGKTLLIAGLGGIGTEIARRADALGMRVIATRNSSREGPDFVDYVGLSDELLELAAQADVMVNALPLTEKTTGLFDAGFFAAVKPGTIYLSVGRGKSTVQDDLVAALRSGQLFAAGLDVTDPEPLPKDSPLWSMDNVIITPHVAAQGGDSFHRSMVIAIENLRRYVAGEPLLSVVDLRRGY